ncbi:MAG: nuclear transport factor 2 family protein [Alphaproteobacteria bacterium]|nr:nuclear transport factor 2 family protein [Alphaproteobacteria bacterium]NNF23264.1 nuclear transport factor 2 family protein [Paracoccaceae bacterium]
MTDADLIRLAERYFTALDDREPEALAGCLSEACTLTIETHGIAYDGRAAICELFATRWRGHMRARHHDFTHTPSAACGRIASQFTVTYSGAGAGPPKSNANVFSVTDGRISRVQVYMAGENTIQT